MLKAVNQTFSSVPKMIRVSACRDADMNLISASLRRIDASVQKNLEFMEKQKKLDEKVNTKQLKAVQECIDYCISAGQAVPKRLTDLLTVLKN